MSRPSSLDEDEEKDFSTFVDEEDSFLSSADPQHPVTRYRDRYLKMILNRRSSYYWTPGKITYSFLGLILLAFLFLAGRSGSGLMRSSSSHNFKKPEGLKIVGLVFYGRPEFVKMLDCYLKRDLAENGGLLDEVIWVANTEDAEALTWLDEVLIPSSESYTKFLMPNGIRGPGNYGDAWDVVEKGNLYIKLDDDVTYIHEDAISELVQTKLKHPEAFLVTSNVVNSPLLSWLHYRMGAVHPYMPELKPPVSLETDRKALDWRASTQPAWYGPNDMRIPFENYKAPFVGHRWLPIRNNSAFPLRNTPIAKAEYNPWGNTWKSWAMVAQEHASLFENIEKKQLNLYNTRSGVWDHTGERITINMIAVSGDDIIENGPLGDDELDLSLTIPDKLQRPTLVAMGSIVSHFALRSQHDVRDSNMLDRYKAYAMEMVCPASHFSRK